MFGVNKGGQSQVYGSDLSSKLHFKKGYKKINLEIFDCMMNVLMAWNMAATWTSNKAPHGCHQFMMNIVEEFKNCIDQIIVEWPRTDELGQMETVSEDISQWFLVHMVCGCVAWCLEYCIDSSIRQANMTNYGATCCHTIQLTLQFQCKVFGKYTRIQSLWVCLALRYFIQKKAWRFGHYSWCQAKRTKVYSGMRRRDCSGTSWEGTKTW